MPGYKDLDGKEIFTGKWRTTPTIRYTTEPEGASQPGEAKSLSLERLFDRVQVGAMIAKFTSTRVQTNHNQRRNVRKHESSSS